MMPRDTMRARGRRLAAVMAVLCAGVGSMPAEETALEPPSNLRLFQMLSGRIAASVVRAIPTNDSAAIALAVYPRETAWLVEPTIMRVFTEAGHGVVAATPGGTAAAALQGPGYQAEFGISGLNVRYDNLRQNGIFGAKTVERTVTVRLATRLVRSGAILIGEERGEEIRDTVALASVPALENEHLAVTHAEVPQEGFFSTIVEPLVIVGAVAIAVYLLFTVRS